MPLGLRGPPDSVEARRAVLRDVEDFEVEDAFEFHRDGILAHDALEDLGHLIQLDAQGVRERQGELFTLLEAVAQLDLAVLSEGRKSENEHECRHGRAFHHYLQGAVPPVGTASRSELFGRSITVHRTDGVRDTYVYIIVLV